MSFSEKMVKQKKREESFINFVRALHNSKLYHTKTKNVVTFQMHSGASLEYSVSVTEIYLLFFLKKIEMIFD